MCNAPFIKCPADIDRGHCFDNGACCFNERVSSEPAYCICYEGYTGNRCESRKDDYDDYGSEPMVDHLRATMSYSFTGVVICLLAISLLLARVSRNRFLSAPRRIQRTLRHRQATIYAVPSWYEQSPAPELSEFTAAVDLSTSSPSEINHGGHITPSFAQHPSTSGLPVLALMVRPPTGASPASVTSSSATTTTADDVRRDGVEHRPTVFDVFSSVPPSPTSVRMLDVRY